MSQQRHTQHAHAHTGKRYSGWEGHFWYIAPMPMQSSERPRQHFRHVTSSLTCTSTSDMLWRRCSVDAATSLWHHSSISDMSQRRCALAFLTCRSNVTHVHCICTMSEWRVPTLQLLYTIFYVRTAPVKLIMNSIYMYPMMHFGPDTVHATHKRNRPCLFCSPSMRSIQLVAEDAIATCTIQSLMNAQKCRTLGVYNARARMLESTRAIEVGSVHCWKRYSFDWKSSGASWDFYICRW